MKSIGILFFILIVFGCGSVYRPNSINAPLIKEKNELQANVTAGSSGAEGQLVYSPINRLVFSANVVFDQSKARVMDTLHQIKSAKSNFENYYGEGAVGYFFKKEGKYTMNFGSFIGGGMGSLNSYTNAWTYPNDQRFTSKYHSIFIQPYAVGGNDKVELFAGVKVRLVNYGIMKFSNGFTYKNNTYDSFIEPAVGFKAGQGKFKFTGQMGYSIPDNLAHSYNFQRWIFAFGFHLNFNRQFPEDIYKTERDTVPDPNWQE